MHTKIHCFVYSNANDVHIHGQINIKKHVLKKINFAVLLGLQKKERYNSLNWIVPISTESAYFSDFRTTGKVQSNYWQLEIYLA